MVFCLEYKYETWPFCSPVLCTRVCIHTTCIGPHRVRGLLWVKCVCVFLCVSDKNIELLLVESQPILTCDWSVTTQIYWAIIHQPVIPIYNVWLIKLYRITNNSAILKVLTSSCAFNSECYPWIYVDLSNWRVFKKTVNCSMLVPNYL